MGILNKIGLTKKNSSIMPLIFIPCLFSLFANLDNDIWFLLNHGRYILESGIPYIEPFTVHKGFEFVMQQWLSASIFWIVYSHFGAVGLKILVCLFYSFTVYIIYRLCLKISINNFEMSFLISFFVSILLILFMVTRPYIFSNAIFAIELLLLESYILNNNKKYLFYLPLLSLLLINLHAAMWPILFVILIPYVIDSFKINVKHIVGQGYGNKPFFIIIITMLFTGLINPYGINAMIYLFKSYGYEQLNNLVGEMRPANITSSLGIIVIFCVLLVPLLYLIYRKGTSRLRYILLTVGMAYMALSSCRNLVLYAVCGYFPLSYYYKDYRIPVKQNTSVKNTLLLRKILIAMFIVLIPIALFCRYEMSEPINNKYDKLKDTINCIINNGEVFNERVYTGYDDGGMAEFMGLSAYIDSRAEVFVKKNNKKEDILQEYFNLQTGRLYYKDVLDKYNFTHLIINKGDILYIYLKHDKDYKIIYSNELYTLYKHI